MCEQLVDIDNTYIFYGSSVLINLNWIPPAQVVRERYGARDLRHLLVRGGASIPRADRHWWHRRHTHPAALTLPSLLVGYSLVFTLLVIPIDSLYPSTVYEYYVSTRISAKIDIPESIV